MIPGIDLISLIKTAGYAGIFGIIFAESGLLVGFFLPGDSLLFTAGLLASQSFLSWPLLAVLTFSAAVLGDQAGYIFGKKIGHKIFNKEDSLFFNKDNLEHAQNFYNKHGGQAIILARFMPVVRTLAPILAGVGKMRYIYFIFYNIAGGLIWALGLTGAGYYLGSVIPNIDHYLLPIIAGIIILSVLPSLIHILKNKNHRQKIWAAVKPKGRNNRSG